MFMDDDNNDDICWIFGCGIIIRRYKFDTTTITITIKSTKQIQRLMQRVVNSRHVNIIIQLSRTTMN